VYVETKAVQKLFTATLDQNPQCIGMPVTSVRQLLAVQTIFKEIVFRCVMSVI